MQLIRFDSIWFARPAPHGSCAFQKSKVPLVYVMLERFDSILLDWNHFDSIGIGSIRLPFALLVNRAVSEEQGAATVVPCS